LYVVIQKKQGAPSAQKKLHELAGDCEICARSSGYWILRVIK
jgi:16S rRNA G1207 methylase RsmC